MNNTVVFAYILVFFAWVLLAIPTIYTFLRLASKIGPRDGEMAGVLGVVLWLFSLISIAVCLSYAIQLLNLPAFK